jgi:hypothetical protein
MSRSFQKLSFVRSFGAALSSLALLAVPSRAAPPVQPVPAQPPPGAPAPPSAAPPNGDAKPPLAPPSGTPPGGQAPAPGADDDETVDAEPEPAPTAPPAPSATPPAPPPQPTPPPATPQPVSPPTAAKPSAAPKAAPATEPKETPASDTDSILKDAGYALTPGVTALPINPDFVFSGYLQGQYESHQDSTDDLRQGGAVLNQDRFLLRRGRFKVTHDWQWAQIILELDGNTVRGPAFRVQKAEASLVYGRSPDKDTPPIAEFTIGQFDLPFGFEVPYVPKVRWFMERTQGSRALFPGEPDVGARLSGGLGFARYAVSVTNGEPLDEKSPYSLQDPNANKDITARFGAVAKATRSVVFAGGVSYNRGKGFSPGSDATKNSIQWNDTNPADGKISGSAELGGVLGHVAVPSKTFDRWAVGADLEVLFKTKLGWSMLYGEAVAASNLDRGLFIADPTITQYDVRELAYYVAFTQEITPYGVVGFRYDFYDPNSDLTDTRRARILPVSQAIRTYSPLVGLVLPGRARLLFQYDVIRDYLARDTLGVPTDFANNQWTLRLQVNL